MKADDEYKELTRTTARLPKNVYENLEKNAEVHHRSINEELIVILKEYFEGSLVKLDPTIQKAVDIYAKTKKFTIKEATNYLVSTKISVFEEVQDLIITEANKAHAQMERERNDEISNFQKEQA